MNQKEIRKNLLQLRRYAYDLEVEITELLWEDKIDADYQFRKLCSTARRIEEISDKLSSDDA